MTKNCSSETDRLLDEINRINWEIEEKIDWEINQILTTTMGNISKGQKKRLSFLQSQKILRKAEKDLLPLK